ncbi:uncharacterized protein PHACADRAFT_256760 [Phanerochaete carnosa HHB-10118-sp]|uniref:Uncharacterized protein n=1 Tax=Phanerochaete carnosa (strain HHB-10118-sp) TaxID=650164 RepID=K5WA70_PHACS|nr:uncharacterized protein PHACADRAFT_256760 [Phanerochaete carnosa HHB-10118-sp]EKM55854.1 hypothetical protein PHACADRAFT_256760 [Phanerochaete carnosa HHB-10118-sp]
MHESVCLPSPQIIAPLPRAILVFVPIAWLPIVSNVSNNMYSVEQHVIAYVASVPRRAPRHRILDCQTNQPNKPTPLFYLPPLSSPYRLDKAPHVAASNALASRVPAALITTAFTATTNDRRTS